MNALGECQVKDPTGEKFVCRGPLCMKNRLGTMTVCCERCGSPQPDHPLMQNPEKIKDTPPQNKITPQDFAASVPDRVTYLERKVAAQQAEIATLHEDIAALRRMILETNGQRKKEK